MSYVGAERTSHHVLIINFP